MAEKRALKGKHVDMLDAIAKKLGVDPSEAFGHVVGRAHEQMFASGGEGQEGAPGVPEDGKSAPNEPATRKAKHDAINRIAGREDGDPQTAKKALEQVGEPHDGHVTEDSSNEIQDSPRARGGAPNPLAIKKWASTSDGDDDEEEDEPPKKKAVPAAAKAPLGGSKWQELQRQRRALSMGKTQR